MSLSTNYGTGARKIDAVTKNLYPWDWTVGFRVNSDTGSASRIVDTLSPLDKPTHIKCTVSKIANVYATLANNSIPVANQAANITGQTVFCELSTILSKAATATEPEIQYPVVARVELRLPNTADLLESDVENLVK